MTVLVTGASGYIGRHLVDVLVAAGLSVRVLLRAGRSRSTRSSDSSTRVEIATGDLADPASLSGVCRGIDTVFHLAGYAHADDSDRASGHALHRQVTVAGTRALLEQAVAAGAKKFVFVSSVKAAGEGGDLQLNEDSPASPSSGYGKAKREAERLVLNAAIRHTAVLRLPLVYGRDNKGNLPRMIAAIDRGRFPPPPRVRNRRSMVHVDDVVRALLLVSEDPRAHGQCYIVTDDRDYSTRELYELISQALGRSGWCDDRAGGTV
jgi:nucleoside-diphosphate-sugar epimerase